MNTRREHDFSYQLRSGTVDSASGTLSSVTVAKSGVQATGKFVCIDARGRVTYNPKLVVGKLPIFTDEKTLTTLLGAAQDARGKVKVRSDHEDLLEARAGYATNFKRDGDRVACDIHLNDSYKDRAVVLETAKTAPELIGCSIDFKSSFEIEDGKAFMRVDELYAVDLVDEGAITHAGLFMSRGVDNETEDNGSAENQPLFSMAKPDEKNAPTAEDCMKAIDGLSKNFSELAAAVAKMAPVAPPADAMGAIKELSTQLAALKTGQDAFITEQKAELAKLAQTRQALGLSADKVKILETVADESEKGRLAAEKLAADKSPKTYLAAVAAKVKSEKCSELAAHRAVQAETPELYREHLAASGVAKRMTA